MIEIIEPFEKTLFDSNIKDIGIDIIETGIDSLLKDDAIKDYPIVGSVVKVGQFIYNLYDRNLLKQTLIFIKEFNNNTIDSDKLQRYKDAINNDFKRAEKELGRVLIILNRTIDSEKSIILAKLFSAYINEDIKWEEFREFSEVNERLFVNDIHIMLDIYECGMNIDEKKIHNFSRLVSIGIIKNDIRFGSDSVTNLVAEVTSDAIELTMLGRKFCSLIK